MIKEYLETLVGVVPSEYEYLYYVFAIYIVKELLSGFYSVLKKFFD